MKYQKGKSMLRCSSSQQHENVWPFLFHFIILYSVCAAFVKCWKRDMHWSYNLASHVEPEAFCEASWGHQHQLSEWILLRLNQNTWELQLIPHYWCVEGPAGLQFTLCCDFLLSVFLCLLFAWYTGDKSPEAGNMSVALVFCCKNIILFLCANMCYCLTKKEGITRQTEVCWLMKLEQLRGRSSSSSINTHWDIFMFNDKREKNFLCRIFLTWPQIKAQ